MLVRCRFFSSFIVRVSFFLRGTRVIILVTSSPAKHSSVKIREFEFHQTSKEEESTTSLVFMDFGREKMTHTNVTSVNDC